MADQIKEHLEHIHQVNADLTEDEDTAPRDTEEFRPANAQIPPANFAAGSAMENNRRELYQHLDLPANDIPRVPAGEDLPADDTRGVAEAVGGTVAGVFADSGETEVLDEELLPSVTNTAAAEGGTFSGASPAETGSSLTPTDTGTPGGTDMDTPARSRDHMHVDSQHH